MPKCTPFTCALRIPKLTSTCKPRRPWRRSKAKKKRSTSLSSPSANPTINQQLMSQPPPSPRSPSVPEPPATEITLVQHSKPRRRRRAKLFRLFNSAVRALPILTTTPTLCHRLSMRRRGYSAHANRISGSTRLTGTLFGHRKARVTLAIQDNPRSVPFLLLELPVPTAKFMTDMGSSGLVRVTLECEKKARDGGAAKVAVLEEPLFTAYVNGKNVGYGARREAKEVDLNKSISGRDPLPRTSGNRLDPVSSLSLFDSESDDEEGPDNDDFNQPSFPELESDIVRSIATLGGAVFPKLNWSAPKDAAWISTDGTLRCTSFAEIALLLKSSDSIAHDLSHSALTYFVLALRKYYPSMRPEMEFRCFVRHRKLVAISQREVTSFYPVLLDRKHEIQPLIAEFFWEVVKPRFESQDYTFDAYLTGDGRVKVLDFNPWGAFTLPLLFSWEELWSEGFGEDGVDFRIVEGRQGVRPGLKTAVPYDYLDTAEGSGWDQFLKRADEELRSQEAESS